MLTGLRKSIDAPIPDLMLTYFLSRLEVRARRAERTDNDATKKCILNEIRTSLNRLQTKISPIAGSTDGDRDWIEASRLERLLALVEPKDYLLDEVRSRVAEAIDEKLSSASRFEAALNTLANSMSVAEAATRNAADEESAVRSLLLQILEDLHWAAERKYYSRFIRKSATRRIVMCGIFAEAYASVSGSAISGGTASEYGVEQISNISRFGRLP
jgi:hypothetical protein